MLRHKQNLPVRHQVVLQTEITNKKIVMLVILKMKKKDKIVQLLHMINIVQCINRVIRDQQSSAARRNKKLAKMGGDRKSL